LEPVQPWSGIIKEYGFLRKNTSGVHFPTKTYSLETTGRPITKFGKPNDNLFLLEIRKDDDRF